MNYKDMHSKHSNFRKMVRSGGKERKETGWSEIFLKDFMSKKKSQPSITKF